MDDQVPNTRGIAESTPLISSAMTVTDASDSTPNANLGMSTTLKNMNATPSTSMKQLRSRPPMWSKPADTNVSTKTRTICRRIESFEFTTPIQARQWEQRQRLR
ncbi:hypothetical protein MRX96_045180 [Rhipicephalus microplus]